MVLDTNDIDPIAPVSIEHSVDEIWSDVRRRKLQQKYNFLDYHFEKNGRYFRARAYLDEISTVTLFGPFAGRSSTEPTIDPVFADEVATYLRRRYRKLKVL